MKRFVFKLQALLNIKLALEQEQLAKLMQCDALITRLEGELRAMQDAFEAMRQDYNRKIAQGVPVREARNYVNGFENLRQSMTGKRDEIEVAQVRRMQIRLKLVEIKRDIKVYEKLREKQREEYLREVRLEEDKLIGDILSYQVTTK